MSLTRALSLLHEAADELRLAVAEEDKGHKLKIEILVTENEWVEGRVEAFVEELAKKAKA